MRFTIIRHAETEANVAKLAWQGASDTPLTRRGELQVAATARHIAALHQRNAFDVLYVSTLPRARRTSDAISQTIGLPGQIDHALREFDLGEWEGRTYAELEERENLTQRWKIDPHFTPPGGESSAGFQQRIITTFESLAAHQTHQNVLVVTHGAVIRNLLAFWLGTGADDWARWQADNCSITILERRGAVCHAVLLNDTRHLPPEALSTKSEFQVA